MGNTYIKNAFTEDTVVPKYYFGRDTQKKEELKIKLEQVDIMTSEDEIDELYRNVVQNVKKKDFFFPEAFSNCTNLFFTGSETTEVNIR